MLSTQGIFFPPNRAVKILVRASLFLFLSALPVLSQKAAPADHSVPKADHSLPKYDLLTETKTKGIVDEINVLAWGTRKDFTELIVKSGDDKIHIYLCPKPFQDEMGMSFSKGDEIAVTGSKIKIEASEVILARSLVKGSDTLLFRDAKGNPVWDPRTGK